MQEEQQTPKTAAEPADRDVPAAKTSDPKPEVSAFAEADQPETANEPRDEPPGISGTTGGS